MSAPPRVPDLARVRVIGIDLMDTLIYDPYREAVEQATGLCLEDLEPLRDRSAFESFELGHIDEVEYGKRFFRRETGRVLDVAAFWRELERGFAFLPGMEEQLSELAQRWPVHVLSNYSPWYELLRERFALDRVVAGHHPSYVLGARKPHADFYARAVRRIGVAPGDVLFIDDRAPNVEAARAHGMQGIVFQSAADLRALIQPHER